VQGPCGETARLSSDVRRYHEPAMERLSITRLQVTDRDTVVGLLVAQMREHRFPSKSDRLSQVVARVLSDEQHGFFLVARVDSDVIGVAYVATILSVEHGGPVGWLEELYISPEHREQGAGSALLSGVMERARELGLVAIDLEVDVEHQRAESLYARFGFRNLPRSRWVRKLAPK
jgi:GNAT superfamily N-acetyltransferase